MDDPSGSIHEGSRVGRTEDGGASKRTSLEKPTHLSPNGHIAENHNSSSTLHHTSGMRLFHSRNRGTSSDSNKVFNQDFEQDDPRDSQDYRQEHARPDSFDQYYNNMRPASAIIPIPGSEDPQQSSSRLGEKDCIQELEDPLTGQLSESKGSRKPEPSLRSKASITESMRSTAGRRDNEKGHFVEVVEVKGTSK